MDITQALVTRITFIGAGHVFRSHASIGDALLAWKGSSDPTKESVPQTAAKIERALPFNELRKEVGRESDMCVATE